MDYFTVFEKQQILYRKSYTKRGTLEVVFLVTIDRCACSSNLKNRVLSELADFSIEKSKKFEKHIFDQIWQNQDTLVLEKKFFNFVFELKIFQIYDFSNLNLYELQI